MWSRVQDELQGTVGEATYRIWLDPLAVAELDGDLLVVQGPAQTRDWVELRFGRVLQDSVRKVFGEQTLVELISTADRQRERTSTHDRRPGRTSTDDRRPERASAYDRRPERTSARDRHSEPARRPGPERGAGALGNPKLTFDQFVIGDCNRLAHAAALTVAEMPGQAYNPLFVCGPPGVGKTHLLGSIAKLALGHNPTLTVRCTTGEEFTNDFLGALSGRRVDEFKDRHRHVDVLLVDDVQFLERKARTEEEFFHTFNALYDSGRQIVLSSDRPPRDLQALEDRLRERFAAGLVADVAPPDPATRLAILRKRAHHDGLKLKDDHALELIAERVTDSVRAIEGALIRVVAYSSLTGRPLDATLAQELLDGLYPQSSASSRAAHAGTAGEHTTIADIKAATCKRYGLSADELISRSRAARVAWPRQLAMYLARELTEESLPAIGRQFGGRDHTTVMHAHRRTASKIDADERSRQAVHNLLADLGAQTRPAAKHALYTHSDRPS